jgi:hypothetical protein
MANFMYWEMTVGYQNDIQDKIKSILNLKITRYH